MKPLAALAACACLALSGCSSRTIRPLSSENTGAIIGNLKVQGGYRYLNLRQVGKAGLGRRGYVDVQGNFIFENLPPGRYFLVNASDGRRVFALTTSEKDLAWSAAEVKPGRIAFLGSFVVGDVKERLVRRSTFEIKRVPSPDERAVVRALIPQAQGTGWDRLLEARLKKL